MASPRIAAVRLLTKIEKESAYSALSLSALLRNCDFDDKRDTAFTSVLVYGVLEHRIALDYNISCYLTDRISKLKPLVLNILRVGAFQILYMDKIPLSAAVNEAVNASKKLKVQYASGLINAVLRKIGSNGLVLPDEADKLQWLSTKYSINRDITEKLLSFYSRETVESFYNVFDGRRPIFIRHNTLKCTEEELVSSLSAEGVKVFHSDLDGCFILENTGDIAGLEAYNKGFFHVQDKSSQLCCRLLDVKEGERVLDCCAAPGGKSFTLAQYLKNKGNLYSCDVFEHKIKLIENGALRLGISNLQTVLGDARKLNKSFSGLDKVLCDVPCSGLGVIGRKPEIRYKSAEEFSQLPELQKEILYSCAQTVKDGGTLIYSTCTLNKDENESICDSFLNDFPEFSVSEDDYYRSLTDDYITVFPSVDGGDGFFIAKFIKGKK